MKASELRIGNLISRKDLGNGEDRIETIIELGRKAITSGPIKVICEYFELSPIPLTEEWLLKFGFEEGRNHAGWVLLKDPAKGDYIDDNVLFEFFEGAYDHIKYVHQLQNLYFALTGEELTVKQ